MRTPALSPMFASAMLTTASVETAKVPTAHTLDGGFEWGPPGHGR